MQACHIELRKSFVAHPDDLSNHLTEVSLLHEDYRCHQYGEACWYRESESIEKIDYVWTTFRRHKQAEDVTSNTHSKLDVLIFNSFAIPCQSHVFEEV